MKKFLKNLFFSLFLVLGVVLVVSCDKPTNEPTGGQPTDTHEHVITDDKWYRDSAVHWKECSGCDELIDMNEHTMGDYVQSTTECVKTSQCTVCGFTKTKKNEHNYVDEKCTVCGKYEYDIEVVQYYVRGTAVGTWDAVDKNALVFDESNYTASITVYMEKDTQFKVADSGWTAGYNFGYGNASVQYEEGLFGNNDGDNFLVLQSADYIITVSGLDTDVHTVTIKPSCIHNFGAPKLQEGKTCDYVVACSKCNLQNKYTEHYFEDSDLICDLCGHYDFKEYYVKGSFNGFAANQDFKLEYDETTYTATIDLLLTVGHVFKIGTADGWEFSFDANTVPVGSFVADADNNYMCVASTPAGDDVLFHVTISGMNTINQSILITTEEEYIVHEVEGTVNSSDLCLKGTMTEWAESDDYRLAISDGIASITVDLTAGDEFKIANSDWSTQYHFLSINAASGLFEAAGDDASKPNIKVLTTGTYKIDVANNTCTITLVTGESGGSEGGNTQPQPSNLPVLYLLGNMNSWAANEAYKLAASGNTLTIKLNLYAKNEFKIATSTWSPELNYNDMTLPEGCFTAGTDEKPNVIVAKDGVYNIVVGGTAAALTCTIEFVSDITCTTENGEHTYVEATCEAPKTCTTCEYTIGEALGHVWDEGTTEGSITTYACTRENCEATKEVDVENTAYTLFLNAGGSGLWDQAGAVFWAHLWDAQGNSSDVLLTDENSDGIYELVLDAATWTYVIFVRGNDTTTTAGDWDKKWNQTADLTIPADKTTYTITGWGPNDGTWN